MPGDSRLKPSTQRAFGSRKKRAWNKKAPATSAPSAAELESRPDPLDLPGTSTDDTVGPSSTSETLRVDAAYYSTAEQAQRVERSAQTKTVLSGKSATQRKFDLLGVSAECQTGDSFLDDGDGTTRSDALKHDHKKLRRSKTDQRRKCTTAPTKLTEIERMRLELGLDEACNEPAADAQPEPSCEDRRVAPTIVFKDPTKRKVKKRQLEEKHTCSDMPQNVNEISFKKARHDVLKFGIKGLDKPKQEEAKIALAVQLGAKVSL
ncbi:hypothetical protein HPB52_017144 [Rhipicephalus sanguineus]|uniref:Uncharacterized protein n=1 Tax=Rhipicephalus sanguineus TaxID=34632 RepID=A0A9D4TAX4_RHISA|nr:hypothetical protein HPB52_017144 [Rhipicephalus sanguineus]